MDKHFWDGKHKFLNCVFCLCEHVLCLLAFPFKMALFGTHPVYAVTVPVLEIIFSWWCYQNTDFIFGAGHTSLGLGSMEDTGQ
jgi:hypothetical protein